MAPLIETVVRQAISTFSKTPSSPVFKEHFDNLVHYVNQLTCNDVKLDRSLLNSNPENQENILRSSQEMNPSKYTELHSNRAPVTYVEIFEDDHITIGIFILRSGAKLPLHDHPLMYGILKVIFGQISVQSYTLVKEPMAPNNLYESSDLEENSGRSNSSDGSTSSSSSFESKDYLYRETPLLAHKHSPMTVSHVDPSCILTPTEKNIHEIYTVNGPAAFIDILAPPYYTQIPGIGPRQCLYFIEVGRESNFYKLKQIPSPADYWNDVAPYSGPLLSN